MGLIYSLANTLKKFLGIDANPRDGLPSVVCSECVNALDFWYVHQNIISNVALLHIIIFNSSLSSQSAVHRQVSEGG